MRNNNTLCAAPLYIGAVLMVSVLSLTIQLRLTISYLPHGPFSSDPSLQSESRSQTHLLSIHCPLSHWCCDDVHPNFRQPISSELSKQSSCPSHLHVVGIHLLLAQVKWSGLQVGWAETNMIDRQSRTACSYYCEASNKTNRQCVRGNVH